MKIVPNVEQIAREMTHMSQVGMIIKRLRKLSLSQFIRFGVQNIFYAPAILRKDFAAGVKLLCELEILAETHASPQTYTLHSQMVDMSVALKNRRVITYFLALSDTYSFTPGLATNNLHALIPFLSDLRRLPKNVVIHNQSPVTPSLQRYLQSTPLTIHTMKSI